MAANITIYCLENLTDYSEFERLCSDLMSREGYSSIEPLGGFSDKGRDAIHVSKSGRTTIFAYSVREDWRAKLAEDASKIQRHGHTCDELVFITTGRFTASERDEASTSIRQGFGWALGLIGLEKLRILLEVEHPDIRINHPQIFPPQLLAYRSASAHITEPDYLFISSAQQDAPLADWLTRKLTAEGYQVWCDRFKLLGGERYPEDVDDAIRNRAIRVLALYSGASLNDPEVMRQRALALGIAAERRHEFLIPLEVDGTPKQLDRVTRSLVFIPFNQGWADGFAQLLKKLESIGCPKPLFTGKTVALESFLESDVLSEQTETLLSNCLRIERIPLLIQQFETENSIPPERLQDLGLEWVFREIRPNVFLSFHHPPQLVVDQYQLIRTEEASWATQCRIGGIWSRNLVSELIRKALMVVCHKRGLEYCPVTHLYYFPSGLVAGDRLKYKRPDGSKTYVNAVGHRKYWRPSGSEEYRYYLAPVFTVAQNLFDDFVVLVRIKIRLSDTAGESLPPLKVNSRRKHLCKDWWNNDWLGRMLAVCQYLASDGSMRIGDRAEEQIIIDASPVDVEAPRGIDEGALAQVSYERSQLMLDDDRGLDEESIEVGQ